MPQVFETKDYLKVVWAIPEQIRTQLILNRNMVLAGGFIRDTLIDQPVSDLDIFHNDEDMALALANEINNGLGVVKTDCAYTVMLGDLKVQYIYCRAFTTPQSLIEEFDFSCCGAAISSKPDGGWEFSKVDRFEEDVRDRILFFRCVDYNKGNLGALARAFRFTAKGWYLPQAEMAKIVHHYVGYAPGLRNSTNANQTEPIICLESVQQAVNPRYNSRNRNGRGTIEQL